ncbi:MAG TPA: type II secretion system F family protein, partial [Sedimentisphaerales bacterium]|nr:type II secretion system F family protein [Sedimentisphaerales bacterium]
MPVFQYEALDAKGQTVKSEIEALSSKEAISKIRNMGHFPTKVHAKGGLRAAKPGAAAKPKSRRGSNARVKPKMLCQFARQLSTLQDAGLSILRSLRILEQQQKPGNFKKIIGYVSDDIEGGATLSEAFGKYPKCFNKLFVNMVAAGEAGGVLDVILARLADFMEKSERLKARIKSAMIYPIVVISVALIIVLALMAFVIPQFSTVLQEMTGTGLPWLTQTLMDISNWIRGGGWAVIIGGIFGTIVAIKLIKATKTGKLVIDHLTLKLPVMGDISGKSSIARWTRTLGTLIGAGVPILEALSITSETAGNAVYANMLEKVNHAIRQGDTFANPLKASKTVDSLVVNMIDVGEETGDLDKMMHKIADQYEEQVDVLVGSLMSLLEPIIIVVLGS